ncbi:hypothetical protein FRC12_016574 [Ceratobasidium sp. 428]|nr:hypothetical protein FRC12_016574 [Ceratobasidium sp. 428]
MAILLDIPPVGNPATHHWIDIVSQSVTAVVVKNVDAKTPFLVWHPPSKGSEPEIFTATSPRGLTISDTRFLLNALFNARKGLLRCCSRLEMPGISVLIVILWQFIMSYRDNSLWDQVDILQRRNYIVCPEKSQALARMLFKPFSTELSLASRLATCVDHEDARTLIAAFRSRHQLIPLEDTFYLVFWITQAVSFERTTWEHFPEVASVGSELWVFHVRDNGYVGPEGVCNVQLGGYLTQTAGSILQEASMGHRVTIALVEKTLEKNRLIGIAGQVYLQAISIKLRYENGERAGIFGPQKVFNILQTQISGVRMISSSILTSEISISQLSPTTLLLTYLDWSTTMVQVALLFSLHNTPPETYYGAFISPWEQLGRALGFDLISPHRCAYVRCADPRPIPYAKLMACGACQVQYYCSPACQKADWLNDRPVTHRIKCLVTQIQ